jgi:rhamnosyltransferase
MREATVAIPVRNGGRLLAAVLAALARQTVAHELLICDSGSHDGSVELAREHGARVIEIPPASFSHGGTRNLLMREAGGSHVALLTQDAEPADERWLERLLAGFELARDVALVYGPYRPRDDAPIAVAIELRCWFASVAPDGRPRIDRLSEAQSQQPLTALLGAEGFFTDANACVARAAWEHVPFREVSYAEDRVLAIEMLRAGYAKAYVPEAAVLHSHAYRPTEQVRRSFDEGRSLLEVYGWREPARPRHLVNQMRGALGGAARELAGERRSRSGRAAALAAVAAHQGLRLLGALLGSNSDRMPPRLRRLLSLERRAGFEPVAWLSSVASAESPAQDAASTSQGQITTRQDQ